MRPLIATLLSSRTKAAQARRGNASLGLTTTRKDREMAAQRISLPDELWKPIPGYEGKYEVSSLGRVWSVYTGSSRSGVMLRQFPNNKGYLKVSLTHAAGKTCSKRVHSLVLTAFVGPRPEGKEAAHLNGTPSDNRLSNLEWTTPKLNSGHKKIHGTQVAGLRHRWAILSADDVTRIREMRRDGRLWREISPIFGVSKNTARNAGLGLTYRDVPCPAAVA